MNHLATQYGTRYIEVMKLFTDHPEWAACVPGSEEVIGAEVVYAVRSESAVRLDDVVMRRTDLGSLGNPGDKAIQYCANLMGKEVGWDEADIRCEVDRVRSRFH